MHDLLEIIFRIRFSPETRLSATIRIKIMAAAVDVSAFER